MSAPSGRKRCAQCGAAVAPDALYCPRDGRPLAPGESSDDPQHDPFVGLELEGRIVIEEQIGAGSMGRVYRAFQGGVDRHVAVKILRPELTLDPQAAARFHREARIASRLVHPNVVQILMSGEIDARHGAEVAGCLYLVLEHLQGFSLSSALAAAGAAEGSRALPLARALLIVLQACDAVGEAHSLGIVHRDIKPDNVMLVERGTTQDFVKVLDFGIARVVDSRSMWTAAGLVFGSATYISPEGAAGEPVGPAADVYGLATVLYECLAGVPPFQSDSPVRLLVMQAQEVPAELRSHERSAYVPPAIAEVVMRNLAKDPGARAADGRDLGRQLHEATQRCGLDIEAAICSRSVVSSHRGQRIVPRVVTRGLGMLPASEPGEAETTPSPPGARPAPNDEPASAGGVVTGEPGGRAAVTVVAAPARAALEPAAHEARKPAPDEADPTAPRPETVADEPTTPAADAAERVFEQPTPAPVVARPAAASPVATVLAPAPVAAPAQPPSARPSSEPPSSSSPAGLPRRGGLRWTSGWIVAAAMTAATAVALWHDRLPAPQPASELEETVAEVRGCIERGHWVSPPSGNVRSLLTQMSRRWPGDRRVAAVRREAAERLLAEALELKYAGRMTEAVLRARLAMELGPELQAAPKLLGELHRDEAPTAPSASASSRTRAGP